jgi:Sap, sulfolipid-1-addressing protein
VASAGQGANAGGGLASAVIRDQLIRMGTAIGELLPLAVAIAISVTTIITTVLMLLSPKARGRSTVGLLAGCVVGVGGAVALFALLSSLLPTQDSSGSSLEAAVIKIMIGVLLVVLALRQWGGRPARGNRVELPKWMAEFDSIMPGKALVLGVLLSAVVPKNLLLAVSAGVIVGEARFSAGQASVIIVVFTAIATSTVAVPVVANVVAPSRTRGPFERLREWLVENNVAIMVVVLLVIGVVMIGNGIASL